MKRKVLGIMGVLFISLFGVGIINANAEGFDFKACVKQNECVLQENVTINSTVILENDLVLDLNGYKITSLVSQPKSTITTEYVLTIKDSKGSGKVEASNGYAFYAKEGGTLILESGEIESLYAPFTGNNTTGDMNFIINGGTLTAISGPAIYMSGQVKLEINGGTLNGGINVRMGQITINGGKIINNNPENVDRIEDYYGHNGNLWLSDAIAIWGGTYTSENKEYGNSLNLVINGGTIESNVGNAITVYALGKVEQDINVTINGGTFNGKEISVAVENPETLNLKDTNGYGTVADYTKVVNKPNVGITNGTFNSDIETLVSDGYLVVENNGVYNVKPNSIISTSDDKVTIESDSTFPNNYVVVADEKELDSISNSVISETNNLISQSIKDSTEKLSISEVLALYDINVMDGSEIVKIEGTDMFKVSLKIDKSLLEKYDYIKVIYVNNDGNVESLHDTSIENDVVTFETNHLSAYAVVGYNTEPINVEIENPSTFDNVLVYFGLGLIALIGLSSTLIYFKKKSN